MWRFHEWPPLTNNPTGDDRVGVSEVRIAAADVRR
jgi:hypothetical protein